MERARIRYIVDDVDAAIAFYREHLGFEVQMRPAPGFGMLSRGPLDLLLNAPGAGGAGRAGGEDGPPRPGGWNRFQIAVDDLEATVQSLRDADVSVRGDIVRGKGGDQALVEDPSGNPVELFRSSRG